MSKGTMASPFSRLHNFWRFSPGSLQGVSTAFRFIAELAGVATGLAKAPIEPDMTGLKRERDGEAAGRVARY